MNWPSFVPHARAALEAMLKLPPLDAGAVFNDDGIETVAMTIYERNDSVKSLSEARDISAAAVRVMAEHFRVNGWPTYRTGIPAEQIVDPALKALLAAGYTILPPRSDEIPEPKVGQVWRATNNNRIVPRTILSGTNGSVVYSKAKTTNFWTLLEFQAWARRTGARPVEG